MSRLGEVLLPARLGRRFRWLVTASWATNLGDGIALAAGPLLVASQTRDPRLVAAALAMPYLATLLFGLYAGALADRVDRRTVAVTAVVARLAVLGVLCAFILTGHVDIAVVVAAMFALGVAETFADTTTNTLTPALVQPRDLGAANVRIMAGALTANQMIGPPVGAFLFAAGMVLPFLTQLVCGLLGVLLLVRIGSTRDLLGPREDSRVRHDIREGLVWLWRHAAVRTLALVIVSFNVTWAASWSVLVLWALERLGAGEVGYGLLTTAVAVGGIVATFSYGWLERHVALSTLMRVCLALEVVMHAVLALTTALWLALVVMVVFGLYAFVWGTLSTAVRQRAVPAELQGRVGAVYRVAIFGGMVVGTVLGGQIASLGGVTAPMWFAFVGSGLTLALVWRQLEHIAHADEPEDEATAPAESGPTVG